MDNPWKEIPLSDYESHMRLDSIFQLQTMNRAMEDQFGRYPADSVMILGVAGGNGLEHVGNYQKVYGVDINPVYLEETEKRHSELSGVLECLCLDLTKDAAKLPHAELLIANLVIEYIGYRAFQDVIRVVEPRFVSCMLQINEDEGFVSDSPYLHVFDRLEEVLHPLEASALSLTVAELGYSGLEAIAYPLPNGKQLLRLDFAAEKD